MHDRLSDGRKFRLLTVVDAFSRECVALEVPDGFKSMDVIKALRRAIARHGKPQTLRCDYGSEFTSTEFDQWASWNSIAIDFSRPSKPTDNALVESFNGRVRQELLNPLWFDTLDRLDAKREPGDATTTKFTRIGSLGNKSPREFVLARERDVASAQKSQVALV